MNSTKKGLIIINLGSPESYSTADVRAYLDEFLMDERVMDIPSVLRQIIVKGFINPFRAPKSAAAYKAIWDERGSPLKFITEDFKNLVQQKTDMPVAVAMRYGNPTPATALKELEEKCSKLEEILIAPMYPHYAMSSYETALEYVRNYILSARKEIKLRVLKPFYNEPAYITALAASIKPYVEKQEFDTVLFSYHGLPIRHLKKSDTTKKHCYASSDCCEVKSIAWKTCYKHQVKNTTHLVAEKLNLDRSKMLLSFQSRLAGDRWLQPYTDVFLEELPKQGKKKILVICPSFVVDCLETLEEINIRGRESFMQNGGELFEYAPCLNTSVQWTDTFAAYCNEHEGKCVGLWN